MKKAWDSFKSWPWWGKAVLVVVLIGVVAGVIGASSGGGSSDEQASASSSSQSQGAPTTTAGKMKAAILESAGGPTTDYDKPRAAEADCADGYCIASWNADTPAFDPEGELIDSTYPVFKAAFADRTTKKVNIQISDQTKSVGGKESLTQVMTITCDREANGQIDWDKIRADGIKSLCTYVPHVKFD